MNFVEYFRERNVKLGLVFNTIISFIMYFTTHTFFLGFYLTFDIQFLIGTIVGVIYALRTRTSEQKILTCGLIVGIFGGIISAFLISLTHTMIYTPNFYLLIIYFLVIVLTGIPVGILGGGLISAYFLYLDMKREKVDETRYDEDFYKDLVED